MSRFSPRVNSVPTQTSIHAWRVPAGGVCGADLTGRWSNSGRWWGFCQTAWLLTCLLLLFKVDNQFASVQIGGTQCCSEVENKDVLKICNQDCSLDSIRSLSTTTTFSRWRVWTFESGYRLTVNERLLDFFIMLILGNHLLNNLLISAGSH